MSENILKFIPTDPNYVPDLVAQKMARDTLMSFAPQADGVTANVTDKVQFVDQGGNFQQSRALFAEPTSLCHGGIR